MTYCAKDVHGRPCQFLAEHAGDCRGIPAARSDSNERQWIPLPEDPVNEIAPKLYMGGYTAEVDPALYDVVLSLHRSLSPAPAPITERRWHIQDAEMPDIDQLLAAVGFVFYQWVLQDKRVLVRCQGGLNRSGLVVAHTLITNCVEPAEAIAMVRRARSPYALCNPHFVDYLMAMGSVDDLL